MSARRIVLCLTLASWVVLSGCTAAGAAGGGYAGYKLGCDRDSSKAECAAATGAGAVGGAVIGDILD
jgi:hypothetical protein